MEVVGVGGLAGRQLPQAQADARGRELVAEPRAPAGEPGVAARLVELGLAKVGHACVSTFARPRWRARQAARARRGATSAPRRPARRARRRPSAAPRCRGGWRRRRAVPGGVPRSATTATPSRDAALGQARDERDAEPGGDEGHERREVVRAVHEARREAGGGAARERDLQARRPRAGADPRLVGERLERDRERRPPAGGRPAARRPADRRAAAGARSAGRRACGALADSIEMATSIASSPRAAKQCGLSTSSSSRRSRGWVTASASRGRRGDRRPAPSGTRRRRRCPARRAAWAATSASARSSWAKSAWACSSSTSRGAGQHEPAAAGARPPAGRPRARARRAAGRRPTASGAARARPRRPYRGRRARAGRAGGGRRSCRRSYESRQESCAGLHGDRAPHSLACPPATTPSPSSSPPCGASTSSSSTPACSTSRRCCSRRCASRSSRCPPSSSSGARACAGTGWSAIGGSLGVLSFGLLFVGIDQGLPAGLSSLVLQSQVIFTVAFAAVALGERPRRAQLVGGAIALAGLALIATDRASTAPLLPFVLVIGAAAAWGVANVCTRVRPAARRAGADGVGQPRGAAAAARPVAGLRGPAARSAMRWAPSTSAASPRWPTSSAPRRSSASRRGPGCCAATPRPSSRPSPCSCRSSGSPPLRSRSANGPRPPSWSAAPSSSPACSTVWRGGLRASRRTAAWRRRARADRPPRPTWPSVATSTRAEAARSPRALERCMTLGSLGPRRQHDGAHVEARGARGLDGEQRVVDRAEARAARRRRPASPRSTARSRTV